MIKENDEKITYLRMIRQHLLEKANEEEYLKLYKDVSPVQSVYWNGFGQPPSVVKRTEFNDEDFNRQRQKDRDLIKGRFAGNVAWIEKEELELYVALYRKPIVEYDYIQSQIIELIDHMGPLTIQQIKEETKLLVKEITPALHKLQEACILYEDQYDGAWDRGWHFFKDFFPEVNQERYTKIEALKIALKRFIFRNVLANSKNAKSFYRIKEVDIKKAFNELYAEGILILVDDYYMLKEDLVLLENIVPKPFHNIYALHRNDFLVKSHEHELKELFAPKLSTLEYDHEVLQYLLIDGKFSGVSIGHFRFGPNDITDIIYLHEYEKNYKEEIISLVKEANYGSTVIRYNGVRIE